MTETMVPLDLIHQQERELWERIVVAGGEEAGSLVQKADYLVSLWRAKFYPRDPPDNVMGPMLTLCAAIGDLNDIIRSQYGGESHPYYSFLEAMGKFEILVDTLCIRSALTDALKMKGRIKR